MPPGAGGRQEASPREAPLLVQAGFGRGARCLPKPQPRGQAEVLLAGNGTRPQTEQVFRKRSSAEQPRDIANNHAGVVRQGGAWPDAWHSAWAPGLPEPAGRSRGGLAQQAAQGGRTGQTGAAGVPLRTHRCSVRDREERCETRSLSRPLARPMWSRAMLGSSVEATRQKRRSPSGSHCREGLPPPLGLPQPSGRPIFAKPCS